jgi:nitrate/TMAO reductase-like tetraheme cytochrome c subunit
MKVTSGQDCERCHSRITKPMANLPAEECLTCHTADIGKVSEKVRFPHDKHIESGVECPLCHVGVDQAPHRVFARSATALPKLGHAFCVTCHSGDVPAGDQVPDGADCAKCHVEF